MAIKSRIHVSIPIGSIKRYDNEGDFQATKVFQFQSVRLKVVQLSLMPQSISRFNSNRFD